MHILIKIWNKWDIVYEYKPELEIWNFTAPGSSQTIISHEKLSRLKEKESLNNSHQGKRLTRIETRIRVEDSTNMGEILLYSNDLIIKTSMY